MEKNRKAEKIMMLTGIEIPTEVICRIEKFIGSATSIKMYISKSPNLQIFKSIQ